MLWTIDAVKRERGNKSRTSVYNDVRDGLLTPPIAIGPRSRRWPDYEIATINSARIAGRSDEDIRRLVIQLLDVRKQQDPMNPGEPAPNSSATQKSGLRLPQQEQGPLK